MRMPLRPTFSRDFHVKRLAASQKTERLKQGVERWRVVCLLGYNSRRANDRRQTHKTQALIWRGFEGVCARPMRF